MKTTVPVRHDAMRRAWVAIVLYEGAYLADVAATLHVLRHMPRAWRPVLVAAARDPVPVDPIGSLAAAFTFGDAPELHAMVLPGGDLGAIRACVDEPLQAFLAAARADALATCGLGTLVAASAGLLGARRATTHPDYVAYLARLGVVPVSRTLVVDGTAISASGSHAAHPMARALIARLCGPATARAIDVALGLARRSFGQADDRMAPPPLGHLDPRRREAREAALRLILAKRPDLAKRWAP